MQPKESKSSKHFKISIVKSIIRIAACIFLMAGNIYFTGGLLLIAEALGIAEEF